MAAEIVSTDNKVGITTRTMFMLPFVMGTIATVSNVVVLATMITNVAS